MSSMVEIRPLAVTPTMAWVTNAGISSGRLHWENTLSGAAFGSLR